MNIMVSVNRENNACYKKKGCFISMSHGSLHYTFSVSFEDINFFVSQILAQQTSILHICFCLQSVVLDVTQTPFTSWQTAEMM